MDAVLRALSIYLILIVIFRISGKRTLAEITTFDFVLILIIAETTQQGLLGEDFSVTNSFLLIVTLISLDVALALLQSKFPRLGLFTEGLPVIIVEHGRPFEERLKKARIDEYEILAAARDKHGLERLDQIKYAVLERNGGISIIPEKS